MNPVERVHTAFKPGQPDRVPDDVGLVHLDWSAESGSLADIDANAETIGMEAVDLLVGQLHANEYGVPRREKVVSVSGPYG
jgi:LacI family transcriptional regulator